MRDKLLERLCADVLFSVDVSAIPEHGMSKEKLMDILKQWSDVEVSNWNTGKVRSIVVASPFWFSFPLRRSPTLPPLFINDLYKD